MTYLPSLIRKIEEFYRFAAGEPDDEFDEPEPDYSQYNDPRFSKVTPSATPPVSGGGEPGDGSLFDDIMERLEEFDNKDLAGEVAVIAAEYRKAIEIGAGFSQVYRDIGKARSSLEELEEEFGPVAKRESAMAQGLISNLEAALQDQAGTATPKMDEATAAKEIIKAKREAFGSLGAQEMMAQPSKFERGDKTGLTSGTVGPMTVANQNRAKYEEDNKALKRALMDPAISENDKRNIPALVSLNQAILDQMQELRSKSDHLTQILPDAPDRKTEEQAVVQATQKLDELRAQRAELMLVMREFNQTQKVQDYRDKAVATTDPREKNWYELKAQLAQISLLRSVGKRPAQAAARNLIREIGRLDANKNFKPTTTVTPERLQELTDKFITAKQAMIAKVRYDAAQSKARALTHGKLGPHFERRKGRRGGGSIKSRLNQYDIEAATFNGLVDKLGEKINTAAHVARLEVTQVKERGKAKTHNALKPFVDALSKALQNVVKFKNDPIKLAQANQAKYEAIRVLKQQLTDWASKAPEIKVLEKNVRLLPFFKKYEAELDQIASWKKPDQPWNLNEAQRAKVMSLLTNFDQLLQIYRRYYQGVGAPKGKGKLDIYFDGAVEYIGKVLAVLARETNVYPGEAQEETQAPQVRVEAPPVVQQRVEVEEPEGETLDEEDELTKLINEQMSERKRDKKFSVSSSIAERMTIFAEVTDKVEYDSRQSMQRAREQGKTHYVARPKGRRGGGAQGTKLHQYDIDKATFSGLVDQLSTKINSATHTARQLVTQVKERGKASSHNALKPYVDAVSKAIQKNDKEAKYAAIKQLKAQLADWTAKTEAIRILEKNVRLAPHFNKVKDDFLRVSEFVNQANEVKLTPARDAFITDTLFNAVRLVEIYRRFYPQFGRTKIGFDSAVEFLIPVINKLEQLRTESKYRFEHGFKGV